MPSKKQRAKAAKAAKAQQGPVAAPPQRPTTLRQAYRASARAIRRADGDTPVFHYGDNVFPRPVKVKPPPPQLQRMCPRWGGKGPVGLDRRAESDECVPDEIAYGQSVLKQIGAPSVLVPR